MERSLCVSTGPAGQDSHSPISTAGAASRQAALTTAVGASYAFDPGVDGLASIYAARVLERGIDPRVLCAEIRADRLGLVDRGPLRRALMTRTRSSRFGRGTAAHLRARSSLDLPSRAVVARPEKRTVRELNQLTTSRSRFQLNSSRKLAAAGLAGSDGAQLYR